MKKLLGLFSGKATRRNTLSLSAIRMQALGALGVYLKLAFNSPATFTQVDIAVTPVEKDAAGVHCDAMIEAFFYNERTEKCYGREGGPVPVPPKVTATVRLRADDGQVLRWENFKLKVEVVINGEVVADDDSESDSMDFALKINLFNEFGAFDRQFNSHRPWGRPILTGNHDKSVWTLDGEDR